MKPAAFKYRRARSAKEAVTLLGEAGEDARFLAGGQSLVPMMNFRLARPSMLIDLGACEDLAFVRQDGAGLRIGAMTRQRDAELNALVRDLCPLLRQALVHAGPVTVRNRATVGGSMANGYPLAQLPGVAVCLGAEMVLQGPNGIRTVPAEAFFVTAMVTALETGELLREIVFPCTSSRTRQAFRESGNHAGGSALAIVCGSAEVDDAGRILDVRIAVSGVDSTPLRLKHVEKALKSQANLDDAYGEDLRSRESVDPASEHVRYAEALARVLLEEVAKELCEARG